MTMSRFRCAGVLFALSLFPLTAAADGGPETRRASVDFATCAKPEWPKEALDKGQHGTVKLEFAVAADGQVRSSRVVATSFHPLLDRAARVAIARCRLVPALERGKPVADTLTMQYVWTLEGDKRKLFAKAPPHLLEFLTQARAAAAIVDPYQRCLAFPDFPGNAWPAGLGKQYCDITSGVHVTGQDVSRMLANNELAELDALMRRDLARHFAEGDFSEVIHSDFFFFGSGSEEANRISLEWIEKAPDSPFANTARGKYLFGAAFDARGGKWISETPRENLNRMSDLAGMAAKFYEKALRLEPRLMPAYAGLVDLGRIDHDAADHARAFARGEAIDAGCRDLGRSHLTALEPRWGGSYEAMAAYRARIAALVPKRPLVALNLALPQMDMADLLQREKRYADVVTLLEPATALSPYSDVFSKLGTNLQYSGGDDWEALVRLLVAYRYHDDDAAVAEARGRLLLDVARDPDWAIGSLTSAVKLDPARARAHLLRGRAQMALFEDQDAEREFTLAQAAPELKADAGFQLILLAADQGRMLKVAQQSAAFIASHPEQPRGYFMRGVAHAHARQEAEALAAFETFVRLAEQQGKKIDPQYMAFAKRYIAGERNAEPAGVPKNALQP